MAGDAECMPRTKPGEQHDPRTCDKTHQAARGGEALRGNANLEKIRQTRQDGRTERSELHNSPVEGTTSEAVRTTAVHDNVFAGPWDGELGRELCGVTEASGKNTVMSTMISEEMSWMDEQLRYGTTGHAWDLLINCSLKKRHAQEQECAASWSNSQEQALRHHSEAQGASWLTLLARAFSPSS